MHLPARRLLVLLSFGFLIGAGPCGVQEIRFGLPSAPAGGLPVEIQLPSGTDLGSVVVKLDDIDVTGAFAPSGPASLAGEIALPSPGQHNMQVTRTVHVIGGLDFPLTRGRVFDVPSPAPALVSIDPAPGGADVTRGAWIRARFASPVGAGALAGFGFALECNGAPVARAAHALGDGTLVLNPTPALPAGASCRAVWRGDDGQVVESAFTTAADAGFGTATALYDRLDPFALAPFPDDYWVVPDASLPSGFAIDMPVPPYEHAFQSQAFTALVGQTLGTDGWSRMQPIVIALSHPLDPSAVPEDELESMEPNAVVQLVDVDPTSPDFGARIPYRMLARTDIAPVDDTPDHAAILFPSIDLREHGRYAVVLTKQAFAAGDAGLPFGRSPYFEQVLGAPDVAEPVEVTSLRERIAPVLDVLADLDGVPIPTEDVALAVSITIRTHPDVSDLTYIKERTLSLPPPTLVLPSLATPCPNVNNFCIRTRANRALEIRGRVRLPDYRDPGLLIFARDEDTGLPVQTRVNEVPFMMTLPYEAMDGPVPIVMYQHGNPGSPAEAVGSGNEYHDDAGFAVAGIQDTLNREIGQNVATQVQVILFFAVSVQQLPDYWNQTGADMIAFLRAIQGMGSLDLLHRDGSGNPAIGPDGIPEIDTSRILYHGISEGGNNAQRFLPFAPEVIAATPTVGGARLAETLIHQSSDSILAQITAPAIMPELRPTELWVGLSLFQLGFDWQDGHTYLKHLYREPLLPFAGSSDVTPPSSLWTEGIGDSLVPNNATRAMAVELGVPQVGPAARPIPMLEQVAAPLSDNLAPGLTAGYFQYDPATTPYCITTPQPEGHYCPQSAPEARAQRLHLLESALEGNPEIVEPDLTP
jgi:hypothetical protein